MGFLTGFMNLFSGKKPATDAISQRVDPTVNVPVTERGTRSTDEQRLRVMYQQMQPNFDLHHKIMEIRAMDQIDGMVSNIHQSTSNALTKGGLMLDNPTKNASLSRLWKEYENALGLNNRSKLASDARGLMMEGNLVIQFVSDEIQTKVLRGIRMPAETIRVITDDTGRISDPIRAYAQYDWLTGRDICTFSLLQMNIARLNPLNFDDMGEMGRPFLDSSRKTWRQMSMTFDDMVIRRRERAPMRTVHVLEGADEFALAKYKAQVENEQKEITTNYFLNRKGGVQALQGDENLDQIKDISLLIDKFFSGTPAPKGIFGFADDLPRDVLMDQKESFFEELDIMQDVLASTYQYGFRLHLLFNGINPESLDWRVRFAERMTATPNQRADLALKYQAIGVSRHTTLTTAGLDPNAEEQLLAREPEPLIFTGLREKPNTPTVKVTPNNAPKGESATNISNT